MKKYFPILIVFSVLLFIFAPLSFAISAPDAQAIQTQYAWIPEPPELQNACYFVVADGSDTSGNNGYIFCLYFPMVGADQMGNELQCFLDLESDGQTLRILAPSLVGIQFYCYVYRLNGTNVNSYNWTMPSVSSSGQFSYKFRFTSNYKGYWCSGSITPKVFVSSYFPLHITWLGDTYNNYILVKILGAIDNVEGNQADIYSRIGSFQNVFNDWATNSLNKYNAILDDLDEIKNALGIGESVPSYETDTQFSNEVESYHDQENGLIDSYNNSMGDIDNAFGKVNNSFDTLGSGFSFVKMIFEKFVLPSQSMSYILIFFSLTFGILTLIIGRKT